MCPAVCAGSIGCGRPSRARPDAIGDVIGVEGYLLNAQSTLPGDLALLFTLFLHQLPLVITAALIPALALAGRSRLITISIITIIVAGVLVPMLNAWAWGGGWLFMLGLDAKFGHGLIDLGGAATTADSRGLHHVGGLVGAGETPHHGSNE